MYEDLLYFFIILVTSIILSNLVNRHNQGPFETFKNILTFIGVIFHEISHFLMCKLLNVPTGGFHVKYRYQGQANPHGRVGIKEIQRASFLQMALIGLAPLFLSAWVIFWLLSILLTLTLEPLFIILGFFICLSLLIGASPSNTDFRVISQSFKRDPSYSCYQIMIVLISGLIVWGISTMYPIAPEFMIIYYFLIGVFYFILKYGFRGINRYFMHSKTKVRNSDLKYKALTRRRINPMKPYKLGREEAQW